VKVFSPKLSIEISNTLIIGTNEIENKTISIKDMVTGSQQVLTIHEFINSL
jgi:histidyl-tRNA synthetase